VKKAKGKALQLGDKIGVVAPASPLHSLDEIARTTAKLEEYGYSLVLGETVVPADGDLADSDIIRRADLERLWQDDEIRAIWCLRGGYGSIRLLPQLWYGLFGKKPKILIGFSDITALEMALWSEVRLVTFHGPVLTRLESEFALRQSLEILTGKRKTGKLEWPPEGKKNYFPIHNGKAKGIILGGNLTTIISLMGTRFLPNLEGMILFIEDIGEPAYRIDRMLTQLSISGILSTVAGIIIGRCIPSEHQNENQLTKVFAQRLAGLECPAAYGFPIGHIADQWTIPQGVMAEVDIDAGNLTLLENPLE
jgi:muramoyltetrapeptide carboxypeptidase